jgi:chromosomal replication initiator protein
MCLAVTPRSAERSGRKQLVPDSSADLGVTSLLHGRIPLIDGVLQLDFPRSAAASAAAGSAQPLLIGAENGLLAPPLRRLLNASVDLTEAASQFNPLVIVGPPGSGKSHIAQGLIRAWSDRLEASAIAYFTAADFGRDLQAARADERLLAWQKSLRAVRLLVIEDIDRLRPSAAIQRELRQVIDAIIATGGMVVVTALREPTASPQLDSGLRDRLVAGLTVRLRRPELAARRAILSQAAAASGLSLAPPQLDQLAKKECSTPAQLMGRLAALHHETSGSLPTAGMGAPSTGDPKSPVRRSYRSHSEGEGREAGASVTDIHVTPKQILALAARYFGLTQAALTGPSRRTSLVEARNVIVHLARRHTTASYAEIGRTLGNRDHTTIMHADRRLAERLLTDPATQRAVDELDRLLGG